MRQLFLAIAALLMLASCGKPLTAAFTHDKVETTKKLEAPATVKFTSQTLNADRIEWNFGDGTTSTDTCPTHTFSKPGTYNVNLYAYQGKKKQVFITRTIEVTPPLDCYVEVETDYGNMLIILYNSTPKHRDNFIKLAEEGYFNDLLFHRVISGFMLQGGDPDSRGAAASKQLGMGGPGYTVPAEFVDSLIHVKGALCAARTGDAANPEKKSSGSQFYIVQGRPITETQLNMIESQKGIRYTKEQRDAYLQSGGTPFLDRDYTVFGRVVKGFEVIDKIAAVKTKPGDRPETDVKMRIKVVN